MLIHLRKLRTNKTYKFKVVFWIKLFKNKSIYLILFVILTIVGISSAYHYQQKSSNLQESIDLEFVAQLSRLDRQLDKSNPDSISQNLYALQNYSSKANTLSKFTSYYATQTEINTFTNLLENFFANYLAENKNMNNDQFQQLTSGLDQLIKDPDNYDLIQKLNEIIIKVQ